MELFQNKFLPGHRNGNEVSPEWPTTTGAMIHLVQSVPTTGTVICFHLLSRRSHYEKQAYIQTLFSYTLVNIFHTFLIQTELHTIQNCGWNETVGMIILKVLLEKLVVRM
jgi:hypothetical protein